MGNHSVDAFMNRSLCRQCESLSFILWNIISLLEQIPFHFSILQCLKVSFYLLISPRNLQPAQHILRHPLLRTKTHLHTSQTCTLLQMIDPFPIITLPQLLPY